jgi:hypothetical protein
LDIGALDLAVVFQETFVVKRGEMCKAEGSLERFSLKGGF